MSTKSNPESETGAAPSKSRDEDQPDRPEWQTDPALKERMELDAQANEDATTEDTNQ